MKPLKIAVNTGGGDAPALNAVLFALTLAAHRRGWHVLGIHKGYAGLVDPRHLTSLTPERVADIVSLGGTILGTTNRGDPFHYPAPGGPIDVSDRVMENFRR